MRRAGAAATHQLTLERLARAMQAHAGVVDRDSELVCHRRQRGFVEVHSPQDFGVFRLQIRQQRVHAGTDGAAQVVIRGRGWGRSKLGGGVLQLSRARFASTAPIVVGERVSQQAVKPCDRALRFPQRPTFLQRSNERGLEHLFGRLTVREPALEEAEKVAMALNQAQDDFGARWLCVDLGHGLAVVPDRVVEQTGAHP